MSYPESNYWILHSAVSTHANDPMSVSPLTKELISFSRKTERIFQRLSLHRYIHLMSMPTVLKDRSKSHPRTCHEALERQYRYSCTVSLTVALCGWLVMSTLQLVVFHLDRLFVLQSDWHSVLEQFWDLISQVKFPWLEALELQWL